MRTRSHPPAWYPDPADPRLLRRWNGRTWTAETRPFPDWLRTLQLSPGPGPRGWTRARRLWALSAVLMLGAAVLLWVLQASGRPDRDAIDDPLFVAQADATCREFAETVYVRNRERLPGSQDAARLRRLQRGWADMREHLAAIPVRPGAEATVDRWLRNWDSVVRLLGQFADEVEQTGEASAPTERSLDSAKLLVDRFAYVNGVDHCLFR